MVIRDNFGFEYSLYKSKQSSKDFKVWAATTADWSEKNSIRLRFLKSARINRASPITVRSLYVNTNELMVKACLDLF